MGRGGGGGRRGNGEEGEKGGGGARATPLVGREHLALRRTLGKQNSPS